MNLRKKDRIYIFILALLVLLGLVGCGKSDDEPANLETEVSGRYYTIHEISLPDGDEAMTDFLSEAGYVEELSIVSVGNKLYRTARCVHEEDDISVYENEIYFQTLCAPYKEWNTIVIGEYGSLQYTGEIRIDSKGVIIKEDPSAILDPFREVTDSSVAAQSGEKVYCADIYGVWQSENGQEPIKIIDFVNAGYLLWEVCSIEAKENGKLQLLVEYEEGRSLLQLEEKQGTKPQKRQIVITMAFEDPVLVDLVTRFNRQSDEYRVELNICGEIQAQSMLEKVPMEVMSGGGPDLLLGIYAENLAEEGFLEPLDDCLEENGDYFQSAIECNRVDGVLYGIPYMQELFAVAYDSKVVGERSTITIEELMDAVKQSDVELLCSGMDEMNSLLYFALSDNTNKNYIDWEKGISHLKEQPFIDLLEFVKRYGDKGQIPSQDLPESYTAGKVAGISLALLNGELLEYVRQAFGGDVVVIGYPSERGSGIYTQTLSLSVNVNAAEKEGAKAFLRFLISEENQMRIAEKSNRIPPLGVNIVSYAFPVRRKALERQIELKQKEKPDEYLSTNLRDGVTYQRKGLSSENRRILEYLFEQAEPLKWNILPLQSVVTEELEPFFLNQRSAAEAAEILDRRVQIYLDENGRTGQ